MQVGVGRTARLVSLIAVCLFGLTATPALAGTADEIAVLPTLDALNRSENPLSNEGKWAALNWATNTSGHSTGWDNTGGWGPYDAFVDGANGAYWNSSTFSDTTGDAAAITMQTAPGLKDRYVALWLNVSSPGSAKTGYQLRWIANADSGSAYTVKLSKWSSGTETVLASNSSVTISTGTTMAISDTGGTVTAWQSSGGSLTSLLSASDSTHASGYAGMEAAGNVSRSTNFKAGPLLGGAITGVTVLDDFLRVEKPLATANWSKASWAGEIGGVLGSPYKGFGTNGSVVASAYWNQAVFSDSKEPAIVSATVGTGSVNSGEYLGLWLDMPKPGTAKSGYEARFTGTNESSSAYKVELSKWTSGTRTVLASKENFSLPVDTVMALTETGGSLVIWTGTSSLSPVVSATDSTYNIGYAGLEVYEGAGTQYNFRAGGVAQAPNTSITGGPSGQVFPNVSFSLSSNEAGAAFECSMDGGAYSSCASPNSYTALSLGAHTFRARAVGLLGTDATPAERTFQVVNPTNTINGVAVLDDFEREELPLEPWWLWAPIGWAEGIGGSFGEPLHGYGAYEASPSGAFWAQDYFTDEMGPALVAATVGTGSTPSGEYLALWLHMPNPEGDQSGYEARFTGTNGSSSAYEVEISRWDAGSREVLASEEGVSLPTGTTVVLSESPGGALDIWTGTSSFTSLLSANDSAYRSGYAGIEVSGEAGSYYNFKAGDEVAVPPETTITGGSKGMVTADVSFTFASDQTGVTFECWVDGGIHENCTSPKSYSGLSEGTHTFRVRAEGPTGSDVTPATREFEVLTTQKALGNVPILDDFNRVELPITNGKWTKNSWAAEVGGSYAGSYHGYGSSGGNLAGAHWNQGTYTDSTSGVLVAATVGTPSAVSGQYVSLWSNMPNPGSVQSGYEARFTSDGASSNKVELFKWVSGNKTELASKEGVSIPADTTIALSETGGSLTVWTGTTSFTSVVSAYDSTYSGGYFGINVKGGSGSYYNFKAGNVGPAPETTITGGSTGNVGPDASFTFSSNEGGATFQCAMDGGAYSSCTSPKSYTGLSEGAHTFKARAVGQWGTDPLPAERTVQVFGVTSALAKVPIRDSFERASQEVPLATGQWTKTNWATEIGGVYTGAGKGFGAKASTLAGAYWNQASFSDANGAVFVAATQATGSVASGQSTALWLDMPSPNSTKSGYQARFVGTGSASAYTVELTRWVAGTGSVLAQQTGVALANKSTIILAKTGGSLTLWKRTSAGAVTSVLTAYDTTYSSGYTGIEVIGGGGNHYNYEAGNIDLQPPDTTITSWPSGKVATEQNATFGFTSTDPSYESVTFECALDTNAYSPCTSPVSYTNQTEGSHTVHVRAIDSIGNVDPTPAQRSFEVFDPPETTITSPTPSYTSQDTSPITFTSDESGSSFQCSIESPVHAGPTETWTTWSNAYSTHFADVNGDGKADIIGRNQTTGDVQVGLSNGSSFGTPSKWINWPLSYTMKIIDVSGDGKADVVGYDQSTDEVKAGLSTGSKFNTATHWIWWLESNSVDFADVNGNGRADIIGRNQNNDDVWVGLSSGSLFNTAGKWTNWSFSYSMQFADVDGDGKADIVGRSSADSDVQAGLSTGSKFNAGTHWATWYAESHFGDVNGDGMADIIGRASVAGEVQAGLSNGSKFNTGASWTDWTYDYTIYLTGDVNGDGRVDITGRGAEEVKVGLGAGGFTSFTPCTSPHSLNSYLAPGWHTFKVAAKDGAGNTDPSPAEWIFNPNAYPAAPATSTLAMSEGEKTAHYLKLEAAWGAAPEGGGVTGVSFQIKEYQTWAQFKPIPAQYVVDTEGNQVSWPLAAPSNPGHTEPVYFDVKQYFHDKEENNETEYSLTNQFRAVFDGGEKAAGASEPRTASLDLLGGSSRDATATIGPAMVDLLTGTYTITKTDVSIPVPGGETSLDFARTYSSAYVLNSASTEVLSKSWQPSSPVDQAYSGDAWKEVRVYHEDAIPAEEEEGEIIEEEIPASDWVEVIINNNAVLAFEKDGQDYVSPPEAQDLKLTSTYEGLVLTDGDGTRTTFGHSQTFPPNESHIVSKNWPSRVSWQATPKSARMVYESSGSTFRLSKMIAAGPGVTCEESSSTTTAGCRTLTFQYSPGTTWEGGHSYESRLASITYYGPSGNSSEGVVVSKYDYALSYPEEPKYLRLVAQWDPRVSPALKEIYTYRAESMDLTSVTPPGAEPWEFDMYDAPGEEMLKSVSRASMVSSPSVAQTTIVYDVPVEGSNAPYDLSPEATTEWGQTDIPVDATAVFPPDQIPSESPTDYSRAMVHYMDPDGYEVNVASTPPPGADGPAITTSETDSYGNVVRKLSAEQRLMAFADADPLQRSKELETKWVYSADGIEMTDAWGPLHEVKLESGEIVEARAHTSYFYDEGALTPPEGTPPPHLVTKTVSGARIPGEESDVDVRVSETKYDWDLRLAKEEIVDPEGLNLRHTMVYDKDTGLPIEKRQPADAGGSGTAGTTKFIYYTKDSNPVDSACGDKQAWVGQVCKEKPAAQASPAESNPQLLVTRYASYNNLGEPTSIVESPGGKEEAGSTRTTTFTYDPAGRPVTSQVNGGGETVPASKTVYDSDTGKPITQEMVCSGSSQECSGFDTQAVTTTYDSLGRPTEYSDADGTTSTVSYDLVGRIVSASDGKGTQTMSYDGDSGAAVQLTDSQAGTFTAEYDADGNMVEYTMPNGLTQKTTYDATGAAVHMKYEKTTYCSTSCTWLDFDVDSSIHGQWLKEASSTATEEYTYDKAGRLTLVRDHEPAGCTTRSYNYDANSNRTKLVTRQPPIGGACDVTSAGTTQNYSYDTGDRLIGSGITYDNFGRITSLASAYAGGGTYTAAYYASDMLKSQSQGGLTNTYFLDASQRQRERVQTGSQSTVEVYHYSGGSDSPAWIQEGANWSRSIEGLDGNLAGIYSSASGKTVLQLTDMHGDVVGTASLDPLATEPLSSQDFSEFGIPKQEGGSRYGWLGGKQRRTELASGIIQMGVRAYVPAMGRFTTPDPVAGGSASDYDYAGADPINGFDLDGTRKSGGKKKQGKRPGVAKASRRGGGGRSKRPRLLLKSGSCSIWMHRPKGEYGTTSPGTSVPITGLYIWGSVTMRGDCSDYRITVGMECYCRYGDDGSWRPASTARRESVTEEYEGFGASESGGEMQSAPAYMDAVGLNCTNGVAKFRTTAMISRRGEHIDDADLIPFKRFVRRVPC